jgi:NAD-dependent SIR2 family protein deacetylase
VLTGAGISTDSGIPGYRDDSGAWKRSPPVTLPQFLGTAAMRQRYWARSMIGWPVVAAAQPNAAHTALARLEAAGHVPTLVTQNVDGLHQRAGSRAVIEADNPTLLNVNAETAADGDAHLDGYDLESFRVPVCSDCGGLLKPAVVFFGESVPRERVDAAAGALEAADAMLVVGSSLMVYSGYRFCMWTQKQNKPVVAINLGRTRADPLLSLKITAPCANTLTELVARLAPD